MQSGSASADRRSHKRHLHWLWMLGDHADGMAGKRGRMNQFTSLQWTDENVARLKELRERLLTSNQMATELGITRGQVMGKLRRLGLSLIRQESKPQSG